MVGRDIDYAATAVNTAIQEKFGRKSDLSNLGVEAKEKTILVSDGDRVADGTRDELLAAVRAAESYENLWEVFAARGN